MMETEECVDPNVVPPLILLLKPFQAPSISLNQLPTHEGGDGVAALSLYDERRVRQALHLFRDPEARSSSALLDLTPLACRVWMTIRARRSCPGGWHGVLVIGRWSRADYDGLR